MEVLEAIMPVLYMGTFALFSWLAVLSAIREKRDYGKEEVKEAVIVKKSSRRYHNSNYSGTMYELDVETKEGKRYHIDTDLLRARFYKEGKIVKIIVPKSEGVHIRLEMDGTKSYDMKQVILKKELDTSLGILIGGLIAVGATAITLLFIVAIIMTGGKL